jgi:hypothetical protein
MKKAVLLAVAVLLLAPTAFSQCQGSGCPEQTGFVARYPSEGTIVVPIRLPQEPASIAEMTSSVADLFAAGVVRNNGPRGITAVRIGWATIDKNGNFTEDQGPLIDMAWPRPLSKGAHAYIFADITGSGGSDISSTAMGSVNLFTVATPEPGTIALLSSGIVLGWRNWKRRRAVHRSAVR